jgi:PLD-like domain
MTAGHGEGVRLVRSGWRTELSDGLAVAQGSVRVVSPFIKRSAAQHLLNGNSPPDLRIVTRYKLADFAEGVSDLAALRSLLGHGARIRGIAGLHSKLFLFGSSRALVTSANLTKAGLESNHELGIVATDESIVDGCAEYFDDLWEQGATDLAMKRVEDWEDKVRSHLARFPRRATRGLPDEGEKIQKADQAPPFPPALAESGQAFVKFFGESHRRAPRSQSIPASLQRSGCHWACTYPNGKRPRIVKDNATMFMAWLVEDPADIMIFGRGRGMRYREGRDDASPADVALRPWRKNWPHYIRVSEAEFIDGSLAEGVSLNELMDDLGPNSFVVTKANSLAGTGNTNPRRSYGQQPAVRLSAEGAEWLHNGLETAFESQGRLGEDTMDGLDWPESQM